MTSRTYERLKGRYELRELGELDVKGKGPMTTYLLIGRVPTAPPAEMTTKSPTA